MALSATVTKKSVVTNQANIWIILFNLKVSDGVSNVIDQDFSCEFRSGDSIAGKVSEVTAKMQDAVDRYKSAQAIYTNAALDSAVIAILGGLQL